jgi:hypothetical protein
VQKYLLFCNFNIFIGANLLTVAKVHKFLFYTLLCRKKINMKENSSIWQYFLLQQRLWRFPISNLKTMSNGRVFNMEVVGNFLLILIVIKFIQKGVRMLQKSPDYFFKSTPMSYLTFIKGRGLSIRNLPLAARNECNTTPHRLVRR